MSRSPKPPAPPPAPATRKARETRRAIIEKAAPLFNKQGVAGTSFSDLTRAAGLTKGGFYGHFKNKDEIALHAFDFNVDFIVGNLKAEMERAETAAEKLRAYPRTYRNIGHAMLANGGCPIANAATEADDTHPELLERVVERIDIWRKDIMRHVLRGIEKGEIQAEVDPDAFARNFISLIEGGSVLAKTTGETRYLLDAIDGVEEMIAGIAKEQ
ncbi:MAG: TetR/AcrR family transcriptional regulator [Desulfococcaceae bacterium]